LFSKESRTARTLIELQITQTLRATVNQELNKARRLAGSERLDTINRWLVAMDLIDMADNLIEELSNGNS